MHRTHRLISALAAAFLVTYALSGCVINAPAAGSAPPVATASATPSKAVDADAKSATYADVYREFLAGTDSMYQAGLWDASKVAPYATLKYLTSELANVQTFTDIGAHSTGTSRLLRTRFKTDLFDINSVGAIIYACVDRSGLRIIDKNGSDITPPAASLSAATFAVTLTRREGPTPKVDDVVRLKDFTIC